MKLSIFILCIYMIAGEIESEVYSLKIATRIEDESKKYLAADLYSSDTNSAKPVILIQTPYNKNLMKQLFQFPVLQKEFQLPIDTVSYNYVIMDWRGFYSSKDAAVPAYERGKDGYDAVEWIAEQNWCNGKVGTWGPSALGQIQFQTARLKPPHLLCAVPLVKDYKAKYSDYYYGGVFRKEHIESLIQLGFIESTDFITSHPLYDYTWKTLETINDYPEEINIPMLLISGWYDHYPSDVIRAFHDLRTRSTENVRFQHKLIMGPWLHSEIGKKQQGILEYPDAVNVSKDATKMFFDYYLLGAKNNWNSYPDINYFVMGDNNWYVTKNWYGESNDTIKLYLHPDKSLKHQPVPITIKEVPPDTIIYNPQDPSPTLGGERFPGFAPSIPLGPQDMRDSVESRNDVLIFSTDVLKKPVFLIGKLKLKLFVSSNRKDTDFAVRLCDVLPDGTSIILRQGIKRMRFRNTYEKEELLSPSEIYTVDVEIDDLAVSFEIGHRLRIIVSSSDYPHYDINLNNGGELYKPGDTLIATNLVYHDNGNQSAVIIPSRIETGTKNKMLDDYAELNIYPNPVSDNLTIYLKNDYLGSIKVDIIDLLGNTLFSTTNKKTEYLKAIPIITSRLSPGLYFIRIYSGRAIFESFIKR